MFWIYPIYITFGVLIEIQMQIMYQYTKYNNLRRNNLRGDQRSFKVIRPLYRVIHKIRNHLLG